MNTAVRDAMDALPHTAQEKALSINLDGLTYGTFAEIGAGQEVARWFFHVGKASSTVAGSISAYDMAVSDALYGPTRHYVSRERLAAMLDREFSVLVQQLDSIRGDRNAFFVFADTIATHGSMPSSEGHGWLGVRFQDHPKAEPSEVILHVELADTVITSRQQAVGFLGVNLIYGAFHLHQDPAALILSLMDGLDRRRVEIDMIKFSGPAFNGIDNRLMSLQLVEQGLTSAAMFTAEGEVVQPSEILHNRPVLIERGTFRPITNVSMAMLDVARRRCKSDFPVVLMEMTLKNLRSGATVDHRDFLARADTLGALHQMVMISNFERFDAVTAYLRQYTDNLIGMVVGVPVLRDIFDEQYYKDAQGGLLEGLGRLFRGTTKLFVYPTVSSATGKVEIASDLTVPPNLRDLLSYVLSNGLVEPIEASDTAQLHVAPRDVLAKIKSGDPSWKTFVPPEAAALIQSRSLFQ